VSESSKTARRVLAWRIAAGAAGIAAALACASPPPPEPETPYQDQVSRWNGEREADLVTSWGMPQKTHVLAGGGRIIEYRNESEGETSCTTRFTLDASGKIVRSWYTGVSCSPPKSG